VALFRLQVWRGAGTHGCPDCLVRYEAIESVNWDGDEFYGYPHIYCHFTEKGRKPYERLVFCEMLTTRGFTHYREVAELDKVVRLSKKLGVGHDA
jgi:hypothetical protein